MRRCAAVLVVFAAAAVLFSGCSRIIGQPYDNFTAYYNTFYNAKQEFERAEEQLLTEDQPVDRERYLALFIEPEGRAADGFDKAVEKGADLLREHPESKWVDDALLLIGKAYFYQGNFSGAEQKFRETVALDDDRLEDEARFWLGRTLTAAEQFDDAALELREGLDREGVRERWASQMRLALAEVDVREGEWAEAAASLRAGLDGVRDDELAARATFLLGQVYETLGRPADAADAYGRVLDFGPRYEVSYAAQLSRAIALGEAGEGEQALDVLRRMRRDDKNFENLAEVELTRGRVLAASGQPDEGRLLLRRLLYEPDPALRVGAIQGQVHYRLAEIYRGGLGDYIRAAAHYDSAATSIRRSDILDNQATADAIVDAPDQSETFGNFARVAVEIAEMDSLLYLGSLDDEAFATAIDQIREQRAREAEERERTLARQRSEQGFRGGPGLEGFGNDQRGAVGGETDAGGGTANTGFLSYRNPVRLQEALVAFQARWGDRPLVPNWRRASAVSAAIAVQEGVADDLGETPSIQTPNFSREDFVDISAVPRDPFTQQRMRATRAAARYELGNVLFLSLAEPDSASALYRLVIDEDPDAPIAQRAYFALAEAQRALGNTTEAERLYSKILDRYPDSRFAEQARTELGLAPVERVATADSTGLAAAAYDEAYARWKDGAYAEAFDRFLTLSERYPTTPAAARARLAAGALYTEWASGSETALFALEPLILTGGGTPPADTPPSEPDIAIDRPTRDQDVEALPPSDSLGVPGSLLPPIGGQGAKVYTWIVASEGDAPLAAAIARTYREAGFDAFVAPGDVQGQTVYRVGIGQFPGRAEALAARTALPDEAPDDSWLLAISAAATPGPVVASENADPQDQASVEREQALTERENVAESEPAGVPTEEPADEGRDLGAFTADSTLLVAPDSTLSLPDSAAVAAEEADAPWLETLYASIETDYPGTPFAERARQLRDAVRELRDEAATPALSEEEELRLAGEAGLFGDDPIDTLKGALTWSILLTPDRERAEEAVQEAVESGYRTALYTEDGEEGVVYRILVGQFGSEAEAEVVRDELTTLPDAERAELFTLPPDAELEQAEQLLRRGRQ